MIQFDLLIKRELLMCTMYMQMGFQWSIVYTVHCTLYTVQANVNSMEAYSHYYCHSEACDQNFLFSPIFMNFMKGVLNKKYPVRGEHST